MDCTLVPPADWVLVPPGDAALTRRVKAGGPHWLVKEKKRSTDVLARSVGTRRPGRADPGRAEGRACRPGLPTQARCLAREARCRAGEVRRRVREGRVRVPRLCAAPQSDRHPHESRDRRARHPGRKRDRRANQTHLDRTTSRSRDHRVATPSNDRLRRHEDPAHQREASRSATTLGPAFQATARTLPTRRASGAELPVWKPHSA